MRARARVCVCVCVSLIVIVVVVVWEGVNSRARACSFLSLSRIPQYIFRIYCWILDKDDQIQAVLGWRDGHPFFSAHWQERYWHTCLQFPMLIPYSTLSYSVKSGIRVDISDASPSDGDLAYIYHGWLISFLCLADTPSKVDISCDSYRFCMTHVKSVWYQTRLVGVAEGTQVWQSIFTPRPYDRRGSVLLAEMTWQSVLEL